MDTLLVIAFFVVAGLLSTGLMFYAVRRTKLKTEAIESYANEKGYGFRYQQAQGYAGSQTIISDPQGEWELRTYFNSIESGASSSSVVHWTELTSPEGALNSGLAVLGPPLPAKTIKVLNSGTLGMFGDFLKKLMFQYTRGMNVDMDVCQLVPPSTANTSAETESTGTVLASEGQEQAMDMFKELPELRLARQGKNEMEQPVIFRDEKGTRIRLRYKIDDIKQIDQLIVLGNALIETLRNQKNNKEYNHDTVND